MRFDPDLAAIRFGTGLSPNIASPRSADAMLARLAGPDSAAEAFPLPSYQSQMDSYLEFRTLRRKNRKDRKNEALKRAVKQAARAIRKDGALALSQVLLRRALGEDGFRERLTAFWADHFTAAARNNRLRFSQAHYIGEAIRPHVAGRFSEMLRAATLHPHMLWFLDQNNSVGENSKAAREANRSRGLNENLARELLELHTLGVGAAYTQNDVRQLAELLTGLTFNREDGFRFRPRFAEPGAETVLSKSYGGGAPSLDDIHAVLDDLARHPATARHLARKLAVHFTGDDPDPSLVSALEGAYTRSGGHLPEVYAALLAHEASWKEPLLNVKQPMDFVGSTLRAIDITPRHLPRDNYNAMRRSFLVPMELMGQKWAMPKGPDGWPEEDDAWITPQRFAARLQWAMITPFKLRGVLPDPRDFVESALGRFADETVRFAARAAETRAEGVGIVLASPAFQRM